MYTPRIERVSNIRGMLLIPALLTHRVDRLRPETHSMTHRVGRLRPETHYGTFSLVMGPVSTAVLVYVAERVVLRLTAGQIMRKGVSRKIKRLVNMVLEHHLLFEILQDILEDAADSGFI